jgi:DNA-binding NarL/FixJ family response regulator
MPKARLLLVDDHELMRQGLVSLINAQPDLEVVGQAVDGLEALTSARDLKPDLVIMDVSMPISNGLEATRLIHERMPDIRILMLTVDEQDETLFEAIKAGARGYLLKKSGSASFLQSVRDVLAGEAALSPILAIRVMNEFARLARKPAMASPPAEEYVLTARELDVLRHIAAGATDKEIATKLNISLNTVKSHVRGILTKLHAANRWQAARYATQRGLLHE